MLQDGNGRLDYAQVVSNDDYNKLKKLKAKQDLKKQKKAMEIRAFMDSLPKGDANKEYREVAIEHRNLKQLAKDNLLMVAKDMNKRERFKVSKVGRERSFYYEWKEDEIGNKLIDDRFPFTDTGEVRRIDILDYRVKGGEVSFHTNRKDRRLNMKGQLNALRKENAELKAGDLGPQK